MSKLVVNFLLAASFASTVQAEIVDIPVPKTMIVSAFNTALSGLQLHIGNYGARNGNSWESQQSYILLPNGSRQNFTIPVLRTDFPVIDRYFLHYISDLNSNDISVRANGDKLKLTGRFESQGDEIKGKCVTRKTFSNGYRRCANKLERDVQLNNSSIEISLTPVEYNGGISYENVIAVFKTDLRISNGVCNLLRGLCGRIENYIKNRATTELQDTIKNQLNKDAVRNRVANIVKSAIQSKIDSRWTIKKVTSSGGNYIVRVERPDTIDQNTVSLTSFSIKNNTSIMNCPGTIDFSASISVDTKVNGKLWLEYENRKKSGVRSWATAGKGSKTSIVSRQWDFSDTLAHQGKAQVLLSWRGTDGKTYTKRSRVLVFNRSCRLASSGGGFQPRSAAATGSLKAPRTLVKIQSFTTLNARNETNNKTAPLKRQIRMTPMTAMQAQILPRNRSPRGLVSPNTCQDKKSCKALRNACKKVGGRFKSRTCKVKKNTRSKYNSSNARVKTR